MLSILYSLLSILYSLFFILFRLLQAYPAAHEGNG